MSNSYIRATANGVCPVPGCGRQRYGRFSLCMYHQNRRQRTGHPQGKAVQIRHIRGFEKAARTFIQEHANHKGVRNALAYFNRIMIEADRRAPETAGRRGTRPIVRLAVWLSEAYRQGVQPLDWLARLVAVFILRELDPQWFKQAIDDRHFRSQLGRLTLRLVKGTRDESRAGYRYVYRGGHLNKQTVDLWADQLMGALAVLATRLATETIDQIIGRPARPVEGSYGPLRVDPDDPRNAPEAAPEAAPEIPLEAIPATAGDLPLDASPLSKRWGRSSGNIVPRRRGRGPTYGDSEGGSGGISGKW